MFFIRHRDELCRRGDVLLTPALGFTEQNLTRQLEAVRKQRNTEEQSEEDDRKKGGAVEEPAGLKVSEERVRGMAVEKSE